MPTENRPRMLFIKIARPKITKCSQINWYIKNYFCRIFGLIENKTFYPGIKHRQTYKWVIHSQSNVFIYSFYSLQIIHHKILYINVPNIPASSLQDFSNTITWKSPQRQCLLSPMITPLLLLLLITMVMVSTPMGLLHTQPRPLHTVSQPLSDPMLAR